MDKLDFKNVASAALAAADNLLAEWLPSGRYKGHEFYALNPTRADKHLGSFVVNTHTGQWSDFATGDSGGDLISLYAYCFTNGNQSEAMKAVAERLRIGDFSAVEKKEWHGTPNTGRERRNWTAILPFDEARLQTLSGARCYQYAKGSKAEGLRAVYRDAEGWPLCVVQRFVDEEGGKSDLPFVWAQSDDGVQAWANRRPGAPTPLFGLDDLAAKPDAPVLVVEGEKCRMAAQDYWYLKDWAVISWLGGCNGWKTADWSPLSGREVVIWPDCDGQRQKLSKQGRDEGLSADDMPYLPWLEQPGMKAALGIAEKLEELACAVKIVPVPPPGDWPSGYDIADVIQDTEPLASVAEMLEKAEIFPAPLWEGVPEEKQAADGNSEPALQGGEGVDDDGRLSEMEKHLCLIEGTVKAFHAKRGIEYTKAGLIAAFGQKNMDRWLDSPKRRMLTRNEVNRLKIEFEQNEAVDRIKYNAELKSAIERYIYLDGTATAWDDEKNAIVTRDSLSMALGDGFKAWMNNPLRKTVWKENLVFAPGENKREGYINTFKGLPMAEKAIPQGERPGFQWWEDALKHYSRCTPIQKLIEHLCNGDKLQMQYTYCWLAYPLQNLGAKLNTALVFHGDVHGAGKSWLFDGIMREIYTVYSATLGQKDLESNYTANRSRKLYVVFEEIFNNKQKYDQTGMMKHMITGKTMQVERKFVDSFEEQNHLNCVFLSNEAQPFKIEENDRRYFVVWPREKLPEMLKQEIAECIGNDGILDFYNLLLSFPLMLDYFYEISPDHSVWMVRDADIGRRFDDKTEAPMTAAKQDVIIYGRASWQTFFHSWRTGDIKGVPYCACQTADLWRLFDWWCRTEKEHMLGKTKFLQNISTKMSKSKRWWRRGKDTGQAWIFKPREFKTADGEAEQDAFGRQIEQFRLAVEKLTGY